MFIANMWDIPTIGVNRNVGKSRPRNPLFGQNPSMKTSNLQSRLRTLREQKGLTQAAAAVEIGISRAHLTKIETGADAPGRATLVAIANYFDVSLDWLTSGNGNMKPARALNAGEAALLDAYRRMPETEATAFLQYALIRTQGANDA
ncbi:helix-turn-helix domain-containing protein [Gluconobacter cerinus]|uniref:helix-turn-helix domain-containing protein n=1 Tax=Gluconobacter cerinus TaxID=38307 RepID=UPI002231A6DE|nr:helix-turn-helix transcriptional regulator [Gluconobacter cerinus]